MSTMLRLYIDGDWPARTTDCEWTLYDGRGQLLQRGTSDPRHWPAAEACEIVLSAEQCLTLAVKLPNSVAGAMRGSSAGSGDLLAYAVEERLVGDVEDEHFVAGRPGPDGQTPVWVVNRARLRLLIGTLKQLDRSPRRAIGELQLAPLVPGRWSVCVREQGGFVRVGGEAGFVCDVARAEPPVALRLAMEAARKAGGAPEAIDIYCAQGAEADESAWPAWQSALGVPVRRGGEYNWRNVTSGAVRNLLVGEFAPQGERSAALTAFKPALALGAAALLLYAVFSVGQWIWLEHRVSSLRAQAVDVFRAAFPQVQAIVDPSLQMQRLYDQLKRERGQLGESDFLPMLAAVSEALAGQGTYRQLNYEDGRLEMTVALQGSPAADRLRDALIRQGLVTTLRDSRQAGTGIEMSLSVRRGL